MVKLILCITYTHLVDIVKLILCITYTHLVEIHNSEAYLTVESDQQI